MYFTKQQVDAAVRAYNTAYNESNSQNDAMELALQAAAAVQGQTIGS